MDSPFDDDEVTLYIINWLCNNMKDISIFVHACDISISYEELYEKLIEHVAFLKRIAIDYANTIDNAKHFSFSNSCRGSFSNNSQWGSYSSFNSSLGKFSNSRNSDTCKGKCQFVHPSMIFCSFIVIFFCNNGVTHRFHIPNW